MRNLTESELKMVTGLQGIESTIVTWFAKNQLLVRDAAKDPHTFNRFFIWYTELPRKMLKEEVGIKIPRFQERVLQYAYDIYISDNLAKDMPSEICKFMNHLEDLDPLRTWIKALTGDQDSRDIAIIAHWLWQIKRKALKLPVVYHIMPVIYGKQSSGKSTAVQKLISPISKFRLQMNLTDLGDQRTYHGLETNLVVFFDEMQGIERVNMNVLKNKITADVNTYRKLHTHTMLTTDMAASFIGCSNKALSELVFDSTGMRRFYQLSSLDKIDWSAINSIDYTKLFQGINEKLPAGYLQGEVLEAVQTVQKASIAPEDIELFITETKILGQSTKAKKAKSSTMFRAYMDWKHTTNSTWSPQLNSFILRLKNRGIPFEKIKEDLYFTLSDDCTISEDAVTKEQKVLKFNKDTI